MYKSVANQIQFNTKEDYEKFKATFCSRGQVDFNKIIAMPAVVRDYDPFVDACLVLYLARENKNIKFYGAEDDKLSHEEYDAKYIDKNGVKLAEKYMLSEDKVKKSFAILDSQEMSKLDCDKIGEQAFLAEQKFGQIDLIAKLKKSLQDWKKRKVDQNAIIKD